MEKTRTLKMLAAYGVLSMISELVQNTQKPDREVISEIKALLQEIEGEDLV